MNGLSDMKICSECGRMKPLVEFEESPWKPGLRRSKCEACCHPPCTTEERAKIKAKMWELAPEEKKNMDHVIKYRQDYYKRTIEQRREYNARPENRARANEHCKRYQKAKPYMRAAHIAVSEAVRKGILVRPLLCSRCSRTASVHGHHHDYDKPLDVTWLCPDCHRKEHVAICDNSSNLTQETYATRSQRTTS